MLLDGLDIFSLEALQAFLTVVMIDLVLAGDNAVVIGLAAAGLPQEQRARAILIGIIAATLLRIGFAGITGSIPRQTGSIPRQTGSVPRQAAPTGTPDLTGLPAPTIAPEPPPRLEP